VAAHPQDIPQTARLVLTLNTFRYCDILSPDGRGQSHRDFKPGLFRGLAHIDKNSIFEGLPSRVRKNHLAENALL
jgi:hypothetical protein